MSGQVRAVAQQYGGMLAHGLDRMAQEDGPVYTRRIEWMVALLIVDLCLVIAVKFLSSTGRVTLDVSHVVAVLPGLAVVIGIYFVLLVIIFAAVVTAAYLAKSVLIPFIRARWDRLLGLHAFVMRRRVDLSAWARDESGAFDLRGANLRRANLAAEVLDGGCFDYADLSQAYMVNVSLLGASLVGTDLRAADLTNAAMDGANVTKADLGESRMRDASLVGARMGRARLSHAVLIGADLRSAALQEVSGRELRLMRADIRGTDFRLAYFRYADFTDVKFDSDTNLSGAFLLGAIGITPELANTVRSNEHTHWPDSLNGSTPRY